MSNSEPATGTRRLAQSATIALVFLLCAGTLFVRVQRQATGGSALERALSALQQAGAEVQDRELPATLLTPLQAHPNAGGGNADLLGQALASNDIVLLNFWATWCPPCIDELASLRQLAARLAPAGALVLAVSYDDDWEAQKSALKRHLGSEMPAPILWARDPEGQEGDDKKMMRSQFGTRKLPETYVLAKGRILARFVGEQDWTQREIEQALLLTTEASR